MRLSDIPIKQKLMFTIGFCFLLFCSAVLLYTLTLRNTITGYEHLLNHEIAIRQHASQISLYVLQARKDEKDFLARKDPAHALAAIQNVQRAIQEAQAVERLVPPTDRGLEIRQQLRLTDHLKQYEQSFQAIVAAWEVRGLDHEHGQHKTLRDAAHAMERAFRNMNADGILNDLEHLLRLALTASIPATPDTVTPVTHMVRTLRQSLQSKADQSPLERQILHGLKKFAAAFERWHARGGEGTASREVLLQLIHQVSRETIPGAQMVYLTLRRMEKDYLMRQDESLLPLFHEEAQRLHLLIQQSMVSEEIKKRLDGHLTNYLETMKAMAITDANIRQTMTSMRHEVHLTEPLVANISAIADELVAASAAKTRQSAERRAQFIFIVSLFAIIICGWLSYMIVRSIVSAIANLWHFSHEVAGGNLEAKTTLDSQDEIGQLAVVMREMVNRMRAMRLIADRMVMIMALAARGAIPDPLDAKFQGDFQKMCSALNDMIRRLQELRLIADHVDRISRGEVPGKLDGQFQGDFKRMVDAINVIINQLGERHQ
ncbi:MAG: methyl-accepting chemotaxis protein [Magnetococcales bacterium]|nr:methyl-accepting chemotaxis protein [Magnetococcales bacterium]